MSVSLRQAGWLPGPPLLHSGLAWTQLHAHPSALVWVLEFALTNRPLNLTHIQQIHIYKQPEPPGVAPLLAAAECLATTLIRQPSNPHQFLGSQLDSPEPMRCRRGRWTWESPNQIPRSDPSRSLFCCMSVFLRLINFYLAFHLNPALPECVVLAKHTHKPKSRPLKCSGACFGLEHGMIRTLFCSQNSKKYNPI